MVSVLTVLVAPSAAKAVEYPAGRRIYSVALGAIPAPGVATGPVWVRIALYYFFGDGTVRESFWFWSKTQAIGAASTGIASAGCDNCTVRTSAGFEDSAKVLYGTYTNTAGSVTITWSTGQAETWRVSQPAPDLSRMDLVSSNYDARVGWAFGSSASNDAYTTLSAVPRKPYYGRYAGYNNAVGVQGPSVMQLQDFQQCHSKCLSYLSAPSTACSACPGGGSSSPIRYYLAGEGKKNYYEHWCRCLTTANCYTGGSHRKPLLQVLGDTGTFHGWVGVEASNFTAGSGFFAVNYHVDV